MDQTNNQQQSTQPASSIHLQMESENKKKLIVMGIVIGVIIALIGVFAISYYSGPPQDSGSDLQVETDTGTEITPENQGQIIDGAVDNVVDTLDNLDTTVDFEDFDGELELGL